MSDMATGFFAWTVRASRSDLNEVRVYVRSHAFSVGKQAGFDQKEAHPSAVETLIGAFAADLIAGFGTQAAKRRVAVYAMEASLSGSLNNPLTHLGVIGEAGHPGLEAIRGVFYVSADADEPTLRGLWEETLARSPLFHTLNRSVTLSVELQIVY